MSPLHTAAFRCVAVASLLGGGCFTSIDYSVLSPECISTCDCNVVTILSPVSDIPLPVSGDVTVAISLAAPKETSASLALEWSLDGEQWAPATVVGDLNDQVVTAEGTFHQVVWKSVADLGYTNTDGLSLRVTATSSCGTWATHVASEVDVYNVECTLLLEQPDEAVDGLTAVNFTVSHPDSAYVNVRLSYSTDGGETFLPAILEDGDCDGDGQADLYGGLTTSPGGEAHCVRWDTESSLTEDISTTLKVECADVATDAAESVALSEPFLVTNHPEPDPGEVVVTEVLSDPWLISGSYIELHNRTNHTLNMDGLLIEIWNSDRDPDTTAARGKHKLEATSGTTEVPAKGFAVIAGNENPQENGCIAVDEPWGDNIDLRRVQHIRLSLGGEMISNLSLTQAGFPPEEYGVAIGADPSTWSSSAVEDAESWCYQSTAVPICEGVDELDIPVGTPGALNDGC